MVLAVGEACLRSFFRFKNSNENHAGCYAERGTRFTLRFQVCSVVSET